MSAAEWYEISYLAYTAATEAFALIITVATAYIVSAYLVGSKLTRSQVTLINMVFVPAMIYFALVLFGGLGDSIHARREAAAVIESIEVMGTSGELVYLAFSLFIVFGVLVISLKFMWDVRHPK